jgi:desulfoferrodoxin (superoxide reductase-like protein)
VLVFLIITIYYDLRSGSVTIALRAFYRRRMKMLSRKSLAVLGGVALMALVLCGQAFANKSAVSIKAPSEVPRGSQVVIQVTVSHNDNSVLHYTDWLYVMVNGKELERWNYTAFARPEAADFTREIKVTAADNLEVKAEANCNVHGSAGPAILKISVKD